MKRAFLIVILFMNLFNIAQTQTLKVKTQNIPTAMTNEGILLETSSDLVANLADQKDVLNITVPYNGDEFNLSLSKTSISIPSYQTSTGIVFDHSQYVKYSGVVNDLPNSKADAYYLEGEYFIIFSFEGETSNFVLEKVKNTQDYLLYEDQSLFEKQPQFCHAEMNNVSQSSNLIEPSQTTTNNNCVEIYLEVDYDIYQDKGNATVLYITSLFDQVKQLYQDENVSVDISEVFVWTNTSPYSGTSSGQLLNQFGLYRTSFNGDLAQLLSYQASGGIAYVDVLCHPYTSARMSFSSIRSTYLNVPAYSWSVMVMAHEIGHNLGSPHTHSCAWNGNNTAIDNCPGFTEGNCASNGIPSQGGTIMSYCHLNQVGINFLEGFGPQPGDLIRSKIQNANCLSQCETDNPPNDSDCELNEVILTIKLDTYTPETIVKLIANNNEVIYQKNGFSKTLANQIVKDTICLQDGCYTFQISDTYEDGICCEYGNGYYNLTHVNGDIIFNGFDFLTTETHDFCLPQTNEDCNAINFNEVEVLPYGINQDAGDFDVVDQNTLYIQNNSWKYVALDYEVTENTKIRFDFKSTREGEIHCIGFDNNNGISSGFTFKVFGNQLWGINAFDDYILNQGYKTYEIPVGSFYTLNADRIFFVCDQDGGSMDGNAWFRNVKIFEGDCPSDLVELKFNHINIFPNPSTNIINLSNVKEKSKYRIFSVLGSKVESGIITNNQIQVANLAPGVYIIDIEGQKQKFIKQ